MKINRKARIFELGLAVVVINLHILLEGVTSVFPTTIETEIKTELPSLIPFELSSVTPDKTSPKVKLSERLISLATAPLVTGCVLPHS